MAVTRALTVSIDAMGGDAGPGVVVSALLKTIQRHSDVQFILHGDEALLKPLLARQPKLKDRAVVRHAPGRVSMKYSAQSAGSGCESGTASHRRSRWRLRSASGKSSKGVRECTIT